MQNNHNKFLNEHLDDQVLKYQPEPNFNAFGNLVYRGTLPLCSTATFCTIQANKQFACSGLHRSYLSNRWRCHPHEGPGPPCRQFGQMAILCNSCWTTFHRGTSPLVCGAPGCRGRGHASRGCSGAATSQANSATRCPGVQTLRFDSTTATPPVGFAGSACTFQLLDSSQGQEKGGNGSPVGKFR